jgi:hypothetical protein
MVDVRYMKITIEELEKLLDEFDAYCGKWAEHEFEGQAVKTFIRWKLGLTTKEPIDLTW